jgi:hypothetical protein
MAVQATLGKGYKRGLPLMRLSLVLEGELPSSNAASSKDRQRLRRIFHRQLAQFWKDDKFAATLRSMQAREPSDFTRFEKIRGFHFVPLVVESLDLVCGLEIEFMRRQPPGALIGNGGDLDNRINTLFDALQMPQNENQIPKNDAPNPDEAPFFFCLLQNDGLISDFKITTKRLLEPGDPREFRLNINAEVRATVPSRFNFLFGS